KPDDVAGLVAYLASPSSGYLTGQVIEISGGLSL
ncbi:MAG: SDR family oxidoreductase, partial [Clostridiaceae bacterium]|nr:SDR family oxidoreductase [Clostridiaceae bacterium]